MAGITITDGKTLTVPDNANVSGTNTGDVSLTGQNYLSLTAQLITANPIDLSGANATGTLAASRMPALTGDVTTSSGTVATTIASNVVTNAKAAQMPANTLKGNNVGSTANASDLTVSQTQSLLGITSVGTALVGQIPGTTTNDNASTGNVGEYASATVALGSAVTLTNVTAANITSISLTAGDWDVEGTVVSKPSAGTATGGFVGWISTASATLPSAPNNGAYAAVSDQSIGSCALATGRMRLSLSTTTTVYLSCWADFTVSTLGAYGFISARRIR